MFLSNLWADKDARLSEIISVSKREIFVTVLSNVVLGTIDEHAEVLLKTRFINQSDEKYPHNALHIYSENALTVFRNKIV